MTDAGGIAARASGVLAFWFEELEPAAWWRVDADVDAAIAARFSDVHGQLAASVDPVWLATGDNALAAVIVLDQFSRNLFRGDARSYAQDAAARAVADVAIATGLDQALEPKRRVFLYMPFMHSEAMADQERCVALYEALGVEAQVAHARSHKAVIERFGRFPKRNAALVRETTREEETYMRETGGSY